jgi:glutamyl-tRNA synthetase
MITRIAPTPSGFLHKGNVFNFLLNWLWSRANGGKVMLRIDDADTQRKRIDYVEDIYQVLEALGLDWDLGPSGPEALEHEWSQRYRQELYESVLQELMNAQFVYACKCSRTYSSGIDQRCVCQTLHLPIESEQVSLKIKVPENQIIYINEQQHQSVVINDFVVRQKDGSPAYVMSSLADDIHFGITHIVRGEDLLESTARQIYIDNLRSHSSFGNVKFWHHKLLVNDDNMKLSKSAGARSRSILVEETPDKIMKDFIHWMSWDPNKYQCLSDCLSHPDLKITT